MPAESDKIKKFRRKNIQFISLNLSTLENKKW